MSSKCKVGIIFGGPSAEHSISILSASFILKAIDREKYEPRLLGITREGYWLDPIASKEGLSKGLLKAEKGQELFSYRLLKGLDVVFPILHGPFGEDGTIQGLLETLKIPYVGSGVMASSIGMDKEMMKRSFSFYHLPQTAYHIYTSGALAKEREEILHKILDELGLPCFVKPSSMGSSLGITQVKESKGLSKALEEALKYDEKVIVERGVEGREIECSLLGGEEPLVSVPGEVISTREFYDYEAKYSEGLSRLLVPAPLPQKLIERFQDLSSRTYRAIQAYGLARVDFFLTPEEEILVNEINTIPGFTRYSMYPLLWREEGIDGKELIHRLLTLALHS